MTNISKRELDTETSEKLFSQFSLLFANADQKQIAHLFEALFTDAEKVMFIKRIASVFLIAEGYSQYAIAQRLNMSEATVRNLVRQAKVGKFDAIISVTRKRSFDKVRFWETVEVLLRGGLPPMGKQRWRWLDKHVPKRSSS